MRLCVCIIVSSNWHKEIVLESAAGADCLWLIFEIAERLAGIIGIGGIPRADIEWTESYWVLYLYLIVSLWFRAYVCVHFVRMCCMYMGDCKKHYPLYVTAIYNDTNKKPCD